MKYLLQSFSVVFLQESTKEAYRSLMSGPWDCLKEIYSLCRLQERYRDGEIG